MAEDSEGVFHGFSEVGFLIHGNTNLEHQRQDHEKNIGKECVAAKTGYLFLHYTPTEQWYLRFWQLSMQCTWRSMETKIGKLKC